MSPTEDHALSGTIFDDSVPLSLDELSRMCALDQRRIVEFVEEGVLHAESGAEWRFSGAALRRARMAVRLERDLELNLAGLALTLDLLEELERLRNALKAIR